MVNNTQESTGDFDVDDVEFLRHDGKPLLARVYIPRGTGPFRSIIEVHGGAWSDFDRLRGKHVHEALARNGITVVAIDFRQAQEGRYPRSVADVNYAIRWTKANAAKLKTTPDAVGISGNSSGGHLAMLVAMKPHDPRFAAIALPDGAQFDASVRCVVMLWPVINPLGRYRYAKSLLAAAHPPVWCAKIIGLHDGYWPGEADMAEGNPMLMLERGEDVQTPPAMWIQASNDEVHNYLDPDSPFKGTELERFAFNYRKAGGKFQAEIIDAPPMFTTAHPTLPASIAAVDRLVEFVRSNIPDPRG